MHLLYIIIYIILIFFSAFFSSAETSLLSINKIKLDLKANKKNKKALLLKNILKDPEEFFSTILIGNNFVNIAAASISTALFTRLMTANEEVTLLVSTLCTTVIILLFAEIIPKSYAFRYSEKMSFLYAYPINFFSYLFYPIVKATLFFSNIFLRKQPSLDKRELTTEEIKHFLSSEITLFRYNPDSLRMMNELIDIAERDIKSIMTPRMNIQGLEESAGMELLVSIIQEKKNSKIPLFRENLDSITGIIHTDKLLPMFMAEGLKDVKLNDIAITPIFLSEYSSIHYALKEFKKHGQTIAVIIDEYGTTLGLLTINDIFREILGEVKVVRHPIRQDGDNVFMIKGNLPVEDVNAKLDIQLPEKKDYTTISGLFIYHYGKFPRENAAIELAGSNLTVKLMGKRKIEELVIVKLKENQ
ncbi:MAG: HlyC/CorC family transporter [bacterium]|nr:HlyC/CorC family transporter [bacterium]